MLDFVKSFYISSTTVWVIPGVLSTLAILSVITVKILSVKGDVKQKNQKIK